MSQIVGWELCCSDTRRVIRAYDRRSKRSRSMTKLVCITGFQRVLTSSLILMSTLRSGGMKAGSLLFWQWYEFQSMSTRAFPMHRDRTVARNPPVLADHWFTDPEKSALGMGRRNAARDLGMISEHGAPNLEATQTGTSP